MITDNENIEPSNKNTKLNKFSLDVSALCVFGKEYRDPDWYKIGDFQLPKEKKKKSPR